MSVNGRWVACATILLALPLSLRADTLYLRDGSRVQGELIAVRNGTIEFEERRGFGGGRTLRFDRNEVARIEFDTAAPAHDNASDGGRPSGMRERQVIVSGRRAVERFGRRRPRRADDLLRGHRRSPLGPGSA